ncbi:DUF6438 domain-containing protein [Bizionia arctica]|uniref:DUF6438 domain-containing protein n=1 Tax=Bizionia arctica TaxID=1495645 RepID=A0A917GA47_9FLAO|nr:DUF6438 domain-containing protein [Bizionia arctica]GGG32218.1 hypothetical protein GCM10010976_00030 [Bizionia arctica]
MKKLLLLILILTFNLSFSQIEELKGKWISEQNEAISIIDTLDSFNGIMSETKYDYFLLKIKSDTLIFKPWHNSSDNNIQNRFELKLIDVNINSLTIQPISKLSIDFFKKEEPITFINQKQIIDKSFKFEKLIFHSSSCFGTCPIVDLEISSNRKLKLTGDYYVENSKRKDKERSGSYIGELTEEEYNKLIDLIIKSRITTYKDTDKNANFCCDGSIKTFVVYHNGIRKYYKAMISPPLLDELISFLQTIDQKSILTKTTDEFEFEK